MRLRALDRRDHLMLLLAKELLLLLLLLLLMMMKVERESELLLRLHAEHV